ncbi:MULTISPECIES: hypothetical protein [Rahnella]|uniref:hypothetical protein n=1 Tax=Rahnella TaxID=34037 RepID=UPI003D2A515F
MITIERSILRKGHIGFKVAAYQQLDHMRTLHSSFPREADWAGFYVAKTKNVAAGYRVDYQHPYGHTVTLIHDMKVLICKGPELENSSITGFAKARMIIDALPEDMKTSVIKLNSPLIPALGRLGFCYQGPHDDEGGIEIIIPNRLIAFVAMHEKIDFGVNKYF